MAAAFRERFDVREATFGRRGIGRIPRRLQIVASEGRPRPEWSPLAEPALAPDELSEPAGPELSPEEELLAWKAERRRERFARFPWRQLSLMAGLCFGIAGFALPDSMNDTLSWLFYALAAAGVAAGILKGKAAAAA
jgi:hypothetical protein